MNDDLISRSALKEAFADMREGYPIFSDTEMVSAKTIAEIIDNAPPADIKPFALFSFDKDELKRIVDEQVIKPIENGELVVKTQGEWIPVSERLPEGKIDPMTNDFELVLCSTVWEVVRPYKFGKPIGHSKAHFWSGGGIMDDYVIAWKPMPEPYKEEA